MKKASIMSTATLAAATLALALGASAAGEISISVDPTVRIRVRGQDFQPKDANGQDVQLFIYNGTTYAPLRALAEAYGLQVGWDQDAGMATVDDAAQAPQQSDGQVVFERDDGIRITYLGFDHDGDYMGPYARFRIENNTGATYYFTDWNTYANGTLVTALFMETVPSGSSNIVPMRFMRSEIEERGLGRINTIQTSFYISNRDDNSLSGYQYTGQITINVQ